MWDTFGVILDGEAAQRAHFDGSLDDESAAAPGTLVPLPSGDLEAALGPLTCSLHVGTCLKIQRCIMVLLNMLGLLHVLAIRTVPRTKCTMAPPIPSFTTSSHTHRHVL